MADLTLILDFVIIFLLITAIMYGFVLNKRIKLIRESGRELSHLFRSFDDTIVRAESSVDDLKKVSTHVSDGLQKRIDKAALMIDELEFIGDKVSKVADKASNALANFKRIENKLPAQNVVSMPASGAPQRPSKSMIPEKPASKMHNKKALEDLLSEISGTQQDIQKRPVVNNNTKVAARPLTVQENSIEKKQFSIASALKALGYGD